MDPAKFKRDILIGGSICYKWLVHLFSKYAKSDTRGQKPPLKGAYKLYLRVSGHLQYMG